jgi:hypothetical protein
MAGQPGHGGQRCLAHLRVGVSGEAPGREFLRGASELAHGQEQGGLQPRWRRPGQPGLDGRQRGRVAGSNGLLESRHRGSGIVLLQSVFERN